MTSPSRAYLMPGLTFRRGPAEYQVKSIEAASHMVCETKPGQFYTLPLAQFEEEYMLGHIVGLRSEHRPIQLEKPREYVLDARWARAKQSDRDQAKRKFQYIKYMETRGPVVFDLNGEIEGLINEAAKEFGDTRPPGRSTLHTWYSDYKRGGETVEALLRKPPPKGSLRRSHLPSATESLLQDVVRRITQGEKRTEEEWTAYINGEIDKRNDREAHQRPLCHIHRSTLNRRIALLPSIDRARRRGSARRAKEEHKSVDRVADPDHLLQVVLVDHTRLQLNLFDEESGKFYGEVWMTVMLCRRSRAILSFSLHVAQHDAEVVNRCFAMMVLPKTDLKKWCPTVEHDWPMYGIPGLLLGDNALEFLSIALEEFAWSLGSDVGWSPSHCPEWKGSLERWFRTIKGSLLRRLTGAVLRPGDPNRPKRPVELKNALTLSELTAAIVSWIVDYYHQQKHSALGISPHQAWNRDVAHIYRSLPASLDDLLARTGSRHQRQLTREGIEFDSDQYKSDEIAALFAVLGPDAPKVTISSSTRTAHQIYVIDPINQQYLRAYNCNPASRPEYTREHWRQIKRVASAENLDLGTLEGKGKALQIVDVANDVADRRAKVTKADVARAVRTKGKGSSNLLPEVTVNPSPLSEALLAADPIVIEIPDLDFAPRRAA